MAAALFACFSPKKLEIVWRSAICHKVKITIPVCANQNADLKAYIDIYAT